uniref:Pectinesterase inhibitor domain-containing protein n=1 Tax=Leersia perrieri TaxID=77586 RepID=A0A0D9VJN8_9ORYZ
MRHLLVPAFFLLLGLSTCESLSTVLQDTCKFVAAGHPSISYSYCIKTFQSDRDSATAADARALAAVAARIAEKAANATSARAVALRASEKDARRRDRLGVCAEVYSDAVDQLGEAVDDVARKGGEEDALTQLSAALDAPGTCEDAFGEADDASPLAPEDAEFTKLATIALAVAASLTAPPPSTPATRN